VFAQRFWCIGLERTGLTLDTRFVPAAAGAARRTACLYLLVKGTIEVHGAADQHFEAPSAFVLSEEHLEGSRGSRPFTFQATGHPYSAVELHFPAEDLSVQPFALPVPVSLDAGTWEAARAVARLGDDDALRLGLTELLGRVTSAGLVAPSVAAELLRSPPEAFGLLWRAFRPMIERLYLTPTLQEVQDATGISVRQLDRHIQEFVTSFSVVGEGWRTTMHHLRLKLAILLLSARGATIGEVANAVGYRSTDAMARAFRDAGLSAPSIVQQQLQALGG
jgi:AraC-like DNA-binding protein